MSSNTDKQQIMDSGILPGDPHGTGREYDQPPTEEGRVRSDTEKQWMNIRMHPAADDIDTRSLFLAKRPLKAERKWKASAIVHLRDPNFNTCADKEERIRADLREEFEKHPKRLQASPFQVQRQTRFDGAFSRYDREGTSVHLIESKKPFIYDVKEDKNSVVSELGNVMTRRPEKFSNKSLLEGMQNRFKGLKYCPLKSRDYFTVGRHLINYSASCTPNYKVAKEHLFHRAAEIMRFKSHGHDDRGDRVALRVGMNGSRGVRSQKAGVLYYNNFSVPSGEASRRSSFDPNGAGAFTLWNKNYLIQEREHISDTSRFLYSRSIADLGTNGPKDALLDDESRLLRDRAGPSKSATEYATLRDRQTNVRKAANKRVHYGADNNAGYLKLPSRAIKDYTSDQRLFDSFDENVSYSLCNTNY